MVQPAQLYCIDAPQHPYTLPAGKKAFIAGVADDQASVSRSLALACTPRGPLPPPHTHLCPGFVLQGFGWAIAKALAEAGAEISLGVWVGTAVWLCWG